MENAVSYAVVKDGERIASVTGLSYDCSSLGAFDSLGVYAEGNGKFTDGEIAYAEITLSGDVWVTIKGIVSVKKVAYSTDGLLQLELNEATDFAENSKILTEGLNIILNGEKLTVTQAVEQYGLTRREDTILRNLMQGKENPVICEELTISTNTLKKHILNIYRKLGIRNRVQLFKMIREHDEAG